MTPASEFDALESAIAGASFPDDAAPFRAAAALLLGERNADIRNSLSEFLAAGAYTDGALILFRAALPEHGFQFGLPPPAPATTTRHGIALSWRRGDDAAMSYRAPTPALALLRAAICEYRRKLEASHLADCRLCGGLGWYFTTENRKQICRHA